MGINVYLIRHGETLFNVFNRMQGWADSPLTKKGQADAKKAGEILKNIHFDGAYSSDTMRAFQTCQTILEANCANSPKMPIAKKAFREQNYGFFEGYDVNQTWQMVGYQVGLKTFKELSDKYSLDELKDLMFQADPFKVSEDAKNYWQRVNQGYNDLLKQYQTDQNVLIVAHSNSIASLVQKYAPKYEPAKNYPANGSITKLKINATKIEVKSYNQLSL